MSDITKVKDLPATVTTAIEALRKFAKYLVIPTGVTTFFRTNGCSICVSYR